jgi:hypothetical protein
MNLKLAILEYVFSKQSMGVAFRADATTLTAFVKKITLVQDSIFCELSG